MKDYQAQLEKLRRDAAECALIRDFATDSAKRELFDRLAVHLESLANHVEQAIAETTRPGDAANLETRPFPVIAYCKMYRWGRKISGA